MKKILLCVLCMVTCTLSFSPTGECLDNFRSGSEPDGFRGVLWGTNISELKDMAVVKTDPSYGGTHVYRRKSDVMNIGDAQLESVEYRFWRGKFFSALVSTRGFSNWSALKDACFENFGEGAQPNVYIDSYVWDGNVTTAMLKYNEITKEGFLYLFSKKISHEQELYELEKAKEGAERGF